VILKSLPSYTEYIKGDSKMKNREELNFATRSTIPWKLECE